MGYYVPSSIAGGPKLRRKGRELVGDLDGPWLRKYEKIGDVEGETGAMRGVYPVAGVGKGALVE